MRESTVLVNVLAGLSVLLIACGALALLWVVREARRFTGLGKAGIMLGAAGIAVLFAGVLVQALLFDGDSPLMPFFVLPGVLLGVAGAVLLGVTVLKSAVLPRWLGILLVLAALLMLGANEQTAAVLLTVPFGLVWLPIGAVLWSRGAGRAAARRGSPTSAPA